MSGSDSRQIPANKVGLYLLVLLAVWLAFSFFPRDKKPPSADVAPPVAESKLHAVGLADNPDWEGLPEFFAVWANHAEWKSEKTQFAYWNPGSNSYSYFFEAVRENGKVRFQAISKAKALEGKEFELSDYEENPGMFFQSGLEHSPAEISAVDFRSDSPTHPFVFFRAGEWAKYFWVGPPYFHSIISDPLPVPTASKSPQTPALDLPISSLPDSDASKKK